MEAQNIRLTLDQHRAHSASGDMKAEHRSTTMMSAARTGRRSVADTTSRLCVAISSEKRGGFSIRPIAGGNALWLIEYVIKYATTLVQTVSTVEFQNGKVVHEPQYFCEPSAAPHGVRNGWN